MATADERLNEWLRDAHAMEEQAEQMLTATAGRIEHYPQLKARIEQHITETRQQASDLKACIDRRGAGTSAVKDMAGRLAAMAQGMSGMFAGDEVVKGAMASYTFEHMEISSYKVLITTAESVGDTQTATVCRRILAEEEAMADWLKSNLDDITRQFLTREHTPGATAKH